MSKENSRELENEFYLSRLETVCSRHITYKARAEYTEETALTIRADIRAELAREFADIGRQTDIQITKHHDDGWNHTGYFVDIRQPNRPDYSEIHHLPKNLPSEADPPPPAAPKRLAEGASC